MKIESGFTTLVFYDGPQLIQMEDPTGQLYLGLAVEKDGFRYPMFVFTITPDLLQGYFNKTWDLKQVLVRADSYFFVDLSTENETMELIPATKFDSLNRKYQPEAGFYHDDA